MELLNQLALGALALPVLGVAAELAARAFLRRRGAAWVLEPHSVQVLEIDRETLPSLEQEVRVAINRDGERGAPPPAAAGTYRVLVAGGSAAECYMLDQGTQWPAVLERELAAERAKLGAARVHVGNIARSLVRCEYIEWMLRATLPRLGKVDAVVLMVGASDLVAWLERGCPREVLPGDLDPNQCFQQHDFGPFAWRPGQLALRELLKRAKNRLSPTEVRRQRAGKSIGKNRAMRAAAERMVTETPDPAAMLGFYEEWLARTIEVARRQGARVLVVRQPWLFKDFTPAEAKLLWNFGQGRPYEGPVKTYFDMRVIDALMTAVDTSTVRVAGRLGVETCELRSRLAPSFTTYYDELHFTPSGAAEVGKLVAAALLAPRPGSPVAP